MVRLWPQLRGRCFSLVCFWGGELWHSVLVALAFLLLPFFAKEDIIIRVVMGGINIRVAEGLPCVFYRRVVGFGHSIVIAASRTNAFWGESCGKAYLWLQLFCCCHFLQRIILSYGWWWVGLISGLRGIYLVVYFEGNWAATTLIKLIPKFNIMFIERV